MTTIHYPRAYVHSGLGTSPVHLSVKIVHTVVVVVVVVVQRGNLKFVHIFLHTIPLVKVTYGYRLMLARSPIHCHPLVSYLQSLDVSLEHTNTPAVTHTQHTGLPDDTHWLTDNKD